MRVAYRSLEEGTALDKVFLQRQRLEKCGILPSELIKDDDVTRCLILFSTLASCFFTSPLQWLPYNWWQIVYVLLRWLAAVYFCGWLLAVFALEPNAEFLAALTIWGFIVWVVYLVVAAAACTVKMVFWIWNTCHGRREPEVDPADHLHSVVVKWSEDRVAWYQKVQWVLSVLGVSLQVGIMVLYWSLLSAGDSHRNSVFNYHLHMVGGLVALIDVLTSGIVMSVYHVYLLFACSVIYSVFNRVYYNTTGRIIYPVLDYATKPGLAAAVIVGTVFVFMPLLYLLLYSISAARRWLVYKCRLYVPRPTHIHVLSSASFNGDSEFDDKESQPLNESLPSNK